MSIQEHLNKIRNAIYGREVRESIAKGIEAAYDDASEKDNANMEVKIARGTHPNLRSRLEEVDNKQQQTNEQLAHKVDKGNVSVGDINKNLGKLDQTYMSDDFLDQIAGQTPINAIPADESITSNKLAKKAVSASKTTFAKPGINKFDGDFMAASFLSDGTLQKGSSNNMLAIVPVVPGRKYYIRKEGGNRRRLGFHKSYPTFNGEKVDYMVADSAAYGYAYEAPSDATYLLYYSSSVGDSHFLQITEDQNPSLGIGYDVEMNLKKGSVSIDALADSARLSDTILYGNYPLATIDFNQKQYTVRAESVILHDGGRTPIQNAGESIPFLGTNLFQEVYFNVDTHEIGLRALGASNDITDNRKTLFIIHPTEPVIYGENIENFEIKGASLPSSDKARTSPRFYLLDDLYGLYERPDGLESVAVGESFELINSKHTDIYAVYNDLVDRYPNYVTKNHLGDDSSGLPIYQYKFSPIQPGNETNFDVNKIKILVTSAIHGYEQLSAWSTALFFKDLCEKHNLKEQLIFMRRNVEFIVVPVCNPWGYDHNTRYNFNRVDLNRNFPFGWSYTDPDSSYPSGPEPASEVETEIIMGVIEDNEDAIYHIDHHNISLGYPLIYAGTKSETQLGYDLFRTMTYKWGKDYDEAPKNEALGLIKQSYGRGGVTGFSRGFMDATTLESSWRMPFADYKYDKISTECAVELFGNALIAILKNI